MFKNLISFWVNLYDKLALLLFSGCPSYQEKLKTIKKQEQTINLQYETISYLRKRYERFITREIRIKQIQTDLLSCWTSLVMCPKCIEGKKRFEEKFKDEFKIRRQNRIDKRIARLKKYGCTDAEIAEVDYDDYSMPTGNATVRGIFSGYDDWRLTYGPYANCKDCLELCGNFLQGVNDGKPSLAIEIGVNNLEDGNYCEECELPTELSMHTDEEHCTCDENDM